MSDEVNQQARAAHAAVDWTWWDDDVSDRYKDLPREDQPGVVWRATVIDGADLEGPRVLLEAPQSEWHEGSEHRALMARMLREWANWWEREA
jgi:hypothetical protein